jgi:hypothetical protein
MISSKGKASALLALFAITIIFLSCSSSDTDDPALAISGEQDAAAAQYSEEDYQKETVRVEEFVQKSIAKVSEITGFVATGPVNIKVINRAKLTEFLLETLKQDYPGDELLHFGKTLIMLGLLPEGMDLRQTLVELMTEQAAAFFDPRSKTYFSIIDLPPMMKSPLFENTIAIHELTHALQDQQIGLLEKMEAALDDSDKLYGIQALIEGQATVVMNSTIFNLPLNKMSDQGVMTRSSMELTASMPEMEKFASAPRYLQETLVSPYAEGASFVFNYYEAHPEDNLLDMLTNLPVSSEQILHFDKYSANDLPHYFDISPIKAVLAPGWEIQYESSFGELDLRILFADKGISSELADKVGNGWDGFKLLLLSSGDQSALAGVSQWDSTADAIEFAESFLAKFTPRYNSEGLRVIQRDSRVAIVLGDLAQLNSTEIINSLHSLAAEER